MRMFQVTYRGEGTFEDMCGGVPFVIRGGEKKQIDEIAARHIFGVGEDNKERALSRLGWLKNAAKEGPGGWNEALARLGAFKFDELHLTAASDGTGNTTDVPTSSRQAPARRE